jgi:hypothetical protein
MKFDQFKIKQLYYQYGIENYTVENGLVNVNGDVNLSGGKLTKLYEKKLTKLPVQFGSVTGSFNCYNNNLTTLKGSPHTVHGDFYCGMNDKLTSLVGSPREVGGNFICSFSHRLTSLKGAPDLIEGIFKCDNTPVHSIFQSNEPDLIYTFNTLFENEVNLDLIEYWFSINNKPLTDDILKNIKRYYSL